MAGGDAVRHERAARAESAGVCSFVTMHWNMPCKVMLSTECMYVDVEWERLCADPQAPWTRLWGDHIQSSDTSQTGYVLFEAPEAPHSPWKAAGGETSFAVVPSSAPPCPPAAWRAIPLCRRWNFGLADKLLFT